MKQFFLTTALGTAMLAGAASAATFNFSQQGYLGGGVFSGYFEGEDIDGDGQINHFADEVTDVFATFQGVGNDGSNISTTFDFSSLLGQGPGLTGLVFDLDGGGTIGDSEAGAIEGFALDNGEYYIAVGPGPANFCDGINDCGFISESGSGFIPEVDVEIGPPVFEEGPILSSSSAIINVTSGPLGDAETLGNADNPFLPNQEPGEDGGFVFEIFADEINPFQTFFIDPEIAVGYSYTITGSTFHSVTAPTLGQVDDADGQYLLTANGISEIIMSGETYIFGVGTDITDFTITGIEVMPGLDPNDPNAFITGVSVSSFTGSLTITQTPIVEDTGPSPVPLPASFLLIGSGLAALGATRRRRRRTS